MVVKFDVFDVFGFLLKFVKGVLILLMVWWGEGDVNFKKVCFGRKVNWNFLGCDLKILFGIIGRFGKIFEKYEVM